MTVEVDLQAVNEALLDQVRDLSRRLAHTTAAVKAQEQRIEALEHENTVLRVEGLRQDDQGPGVLSAPSLEGGQG